MGRTGFVLPCLNFWLTDFLILIRRLERVRDVVGAEVWQVVNIFGVMLRILDNMNDCRGMELDGVVV